MCLKDRKAGQFEKAGSKGTERLSLDKFQNCFLQAAFHGVQKSLPLSAVCVKKLLPSVESTK